MLILSRRIGETLKIGEDINIHILDVSGSQVRIGIEAPKEVAVHRAEIHERIKKEAPSRPILSLGTRKSGNR